MENFYSKLKTLHSIVPMDIPIEISTLNIKSKIEIEAIPFKDIRKEDIISRLQKLHLAMLRSHNVGSSILTRELFNINKFEKNICTKDPIPVKDSDSFIFI